MGLTPAEIFIESLQGLMDSLSEKCLHALFVGLFDPIDIFESIAERTVLERLELGVRVDNHDHGSGEDGDYL